MTFDATHTVRSIVRNNPAAVGVFEGLHIDYCCGGDRTLEDACGELQLSPQTVLAELEEALRLPPIEEDCHWLTCPLGELADHIVNTHHAFTRREMPVLANMAEKVFARHRHTNPELGKLRELVEALKGELFIHMSKEEQVLFLALKALEDCASRRDCLPTHCGYLLNPIRRMMEEHDDTGELLKSIRGITRNYQAPEVACTTFRALYAGLKQMEEDLHRHIHLENNILFPRALELEKVLGAKVA